MALFVKQNKTQTELQSRIANDLQQRLKEKNSISAKKTDPVFFDDKESTTGSGAVLIVVGIILAALALYLLRP